MLKMDTIWLAIDKEGKKIKAHRFAETARNTVFEWSRDFLYAGNEGLPEYYKYSEESCMELMDKFDEKNIPFTVAVIDTYSLRQSPVILV